MKTPLPYVQRFRDRHGRLRYYYRRGSTRKALPDPADGMGEFLDAYRAAVEFRPHASRHQAGTLAALMVEYQASPEFRGLKPKSRKLYQRVIDFLANRPGAALPVVQITRKHLQTTRDELADTPGYANLVLSVIAVLMAFAVDRGHRQDNPARGLKRFKLGEHRAWTADEHAAFLKRWPAGTMQRRAFLLALYTGQRRGDLAAMTWHARRDGLIHVVQEKTGEVLAVPEHSALTAELTGVERRSVMILHQPSGQPYKPGRLGDVMAKAIDAAGLSTECVLHGLRKSAAAALAEAGCSDREIMAITGHRTPAMVSLYTRQADQKRLARSAMAKREADEP